MGSEEKDKKKNIISSDKTKLLRSIVILAAIAALIAGITYAWFFNRIDMATLMKIQPPSDISILGPNGDTLDSLDLSHTGQADNDGKVTVSRVFCVQSQDAFQLEIAHTTNLQGMEFKIYPATKKKSNEETSESEVAITEGDYKYCYDKNNIVTGKYINAEDGTANYKYATGIYHKDNYNTYENVQTHAEPVYWLATGKLKATGEVITLPDQNDNKETFHRTYFVCEISWTETTKETDLFYILAQNA